MALFRKRIKPLIIVFSIILIFVCVASIAQVSAEDGRNDSRVNVSYSGQDGSSSDSSKKSDKKKTDENDPDEAEEDSEDGEAPADPQKTVSNSKTAAPATVDIEDAETPLAGGIWALTNLLACILTMLGAVGELFIGQIDKRDFEDDLDSFNGVNADFTGGLSAEILEEIEDRRKKMAAAKIAGCLAAVASAITFFITEDMDLPMALNDRYTPLMLIILAVQIASATLNVKASKIDIEKKSTAERGAN